MIFTLKTTKGHYSVNNIGDTMMPVLCKLSDDALNLHQVL